MTDAHLQELKRQTRIQAGREAFKACFAVIFFALIGVVWVSSKFPDVALFASPWFFLGAPLALGLLVRWGVYKSLTQG